MTNKNLYPKLAKKYKSKDKNHNGLVIFLSSSLDKNLWEQYQNDIMKYNARAVIKGFIDGSMKKTINFINKIENRKAGNQKIHMIKTNLTPTKSK